MWFPLSAPAACGAALSGCLCKNAAPEVWRGIIRLGLSADQNVAAGQVLSDM